MTVQPAITSDALAIVALTSHSLGARDATGHTPKPLTPTEWARVRKALAAAGATPVDLLGRDVSTVAALLGGDAERANQVSRLAARATSIAVEIERLGGRGIWVLSVVDADYPQALVTRLGDAAPPVLYGAGPLGLLRAPGIAIVGSRDADASALEFAEQAAAAIARSGRNVVSGAARGIDSMAMTSAAAEGGCVLGVLGDSLVQRVRTIEARELIADERLVLVSPFGPDAPFSVGNAMGRNRLIYCLADAAIVVSATEGQGGTWSGAVEAIKAYWVPVHVRAGTDAPAGNHALVARGAIPLMRAPDETWISAPGPVAAAPTLADTSPGMPMQELLFGEPPEPVAASKKKRGTGSKKR